MSEAYSVPGESVSLAQIAVTMSLAIASAAGAIALAAPWLTAPAGAPKAVLSAERAERLDAPAPVVLAALAPEAARGTPAPEPTELADSSEPSEPEIELDVVDALPARACAPRVALVFPFASAAVPSTTAAQLAPIVAYANEHPDVHVYVDGHADPIGSELDNLVLSKRRANAVARQLRRAGLDRARIVVRAFGAYVPLAGEAATELRRVQISVSDDPCAGREST